MPITRSCRVRCRMFLSCLTCPVLLLGEASRRAVVLSSIASLPACLPRVLSPLFPPLCSSGGTTWRWASAACDCNGRSDAMRMSCGCVFLGSLTPRLSIAPPLDTDGGEGSDGSHCLLLSDFYRLPLSLACGSDGLGLLACFYVIGRISPAMRDFCGSRSLRLPGLLPHGILFLCRRGRTSAIAAHRNSLACFSIPISAPLFASSPVFDAYSGHGRSFNPFISPDCSWGRSFRRASARSPTSLRRTGRGVFL